MDLLSAFILTEPREDSPSTSRNIERSNVPKLAKMSTSKLDNVLLYGDSSGKTYDLEISHPTCTIESVAFAKDSSTPPSLLLPTLCHPHIHLDKPFLLTSHVQGASADKSVDYSDLTLTEGSFTEALSKTSQAKERYTVEDLVLRGSQLVAESVQAGVTSMRAFVEVDRVTNMKCIEAGVNIKNRFSQVCDVQLCVFAQDPVISEDKHGPENRKIVEKVLEQYRSSVNVVGSTPYVETSDENQRRNIDWAIQMALKYEFHLDFHLDYNLDTASTPMIWYVIEALKREKWIEKSSGRIMIGHCSRLTLFTHSEMSRLSKEIEDAKLPISFVGLPTSDLFMMGRPNGDYTGQRARGTMQVLEMVQKYRLDACIGINNVGNAFTPWGNVDPLRLACLGVGVFQAGTPDDARLLFECVSARAKKAIGVRTTDGQRYSKGSAGPFLLVHNSERIALAGMQEEIPARRRINVQDVVWDPPGLHSRRVIRN